MARNPRKQTIVTKKHLARLERERLQTRYILIGSAIVVVAVVALIVYGVLNQTVLQNLRPVAKVNGDKITTAQFQAQTRYARYNLVRSAQQTYQFIQMFGSDANTMYSFAGQLQQYQTQLAPSTVGQQVLDRLVEDRLIRKYAEEHDITVTKEEIDEGFQAAFGYYPNGKPTSTATFAPELTSTLSPLQMTLIPPTATPTLTPTLTATPTITPTATLPPTPTTPATATL